MKEKKKKKIFGIQKRNNLNFYLYISPWLIFFLALTVYPMIKSLSLAFTDSSFNGKGNFVGLENFLQAFTANSRFWAAFKNTICYVLMYVPLSLILSFFLGWLLSRNVKFLGFWRTVFLSSLYHCRCCRHHSVGLDFQWNLRCN